MFFAMVSACCRVEFRRMRSRPTRGARENVQMFRSLFDFLCTYAGTGAFVKLLDPTRTRSRAHSSLWGATPGEVYYLFLLFPHGVRRRD